MAPRGSIVKYICTGTVQIIKWDMPDDWGQPMRPLATNGARESSSCGWDARRQPSWMEPHNKDKEKLGNSPLLVMARNTLGVSP